MISQTVPIGCSKSGIINNTVRTLKGPIKSCDFKQKQKQKQRQKNQMTKYKRGEFVKLPRDGLEEHFSGLEQLY